MRRLVLEYRHYYMLQKQIRIESDRPTTLRKKKCNKSVNREILQQFLLIKFNPYMVANFKKIHF